MAETINSFQVRLGGVVGNREMAGQFGAAGGYFERAAADRIGQKIKGALECLEAVMGLLDAKPGLLQPLRKQHASVTVVLDQQHKRAFG